MLLTWSEIEVNLLAEASESPPPVVRMNVTAQTTTADTITPLTVCMFLSVVRQLLRDEKAFPTSAALVAELSQCTPPMMDIAQVTTLFPRVCCIRVVVADAGDAAGVSVLTDASCVEHLRGYHPPSSLIQSMSCDPYAATIV